MCCGDVRVVVQRLTQLRVEADNAVTRAEDAEGKNKKYEQDILAKDQEITSLTHKVSVLEADIEKMESKLRESKESAQDAEANKTTNDALTRKVTLLEEELDTAEKNLKEVTEKCVLIVLLVAIVSNRASRLVLACRLRQTDVKAEHFERHLQRVEQERDQWEAKYEVRLCLSTRHFHEFDCQHIPICDRKCKPSTKSRRRSWTSLLPTWRVSKVFVS